MPLQKAIVDISLGIGIDTKTDEKRVLPAKLTALENGIFNKGGRLTKRNGYTALGNTKFSTGAAFSSGNWLGTLGDQLLMAENTEADGAQLWAYAESSDKWINKGELLPLSIGSESVVRNDYQQTLPDFATSQNVGLYAWEDTRGGVRAMVVDLGTGTPILADTQLNATGERPRVLPLGRTGFVVVYSQPSANKILALYVDALSPSFGGTEVEVTTGLHATDSHFDMYESGLNAVLAYNSSGGNIGVLYLTAQGPSGVSVGAPLLGLPGPVAISAVAENSICVITDTAGKAWVGWHNSTSGIQAAILLNDFSSHLAVTTVEAITSPNMVNITAEFITDGTQARFVYEATAAATINRFLKTNTLTNTGTAGTATTVLRSVGLASKAFKQSGQIYVTAVHDSTLQATYFTVGIDGDVESRVLPGVAGGVTPKASLPRVVNTSGNEWRFAAITKTRIVADDSLSLASGDQTTTFTVTGINAVLMDFAPDSQLQNVESADALAITGGHVMEYDGLAAVEMGFHLFPEGVTVAPSASGGSIADGVYQYVAVYEWIDNNGRQYRSAPSVPVAATVSGGGGNGSVTVTIPTLRVTNRDGVVREKARLEVYRTEAGPGPIFYKVTSFSSPTYNDPTVDTQDITDTLVDSDIIDNELLYTTGGIVENIAPPASSVVAASKNRVFLAGLEEPNTIAFSKPLRDGVGLEFSDVFQLKVTSEGGAITALAVLDDKVVVFKEDRIFAFAGTGPNAAGVGQFSEPDRVTGDVGCKFPNSITNTGEALFFKSDKGFYQLTRSLEVGYVGADVEAFNGLSVKGGELLADVNQVRFVHSDGAALVYDYFYRQWGTFTNHVGLDSAVWKGLFVYLREDGTVYKETEGFFKDNNNAYPLRFRTAWLKLNSLQGFQRIYRAMVLGTFKASHNLQIKAGFDYQDSFPETHTFDAGALFEASEYGDDAYYGEDEVYGGVEDGVYQLQARLDRQKCQAIRFEIQDQDDGTGGEGYDVTSLAMQVGVKRGLNRIPIAKRA
jgi:hypothetical protein